jgi:hypothetical protein
MGASELENAYAADGNGKPVTLDSVIQRDNSKEMSTWLGMAATDSLLKCNQFLARVAYQKNSWETVLDIAALATGGTAAIATISAKTASALAAASTFATGTRTTIDSDIYGQVGITLITSEIRQDYYLKMQSYINNLQLDDNMNETDFINKYALLLQNHSLCTLEVALYNLNQKSTATQQVRQLIAESSLKDGQQYKSIIGEITINGAKNDQFVLNNYENSPTVSRPVAAAVLNSIQATFDGYKAPTSTTPATSTPSPSAGQPAATVQPGSDKGQTR